MSAYRAVLLALFVVAGALSTAVPAGATTDAGVETGGEGIAVVGVYSMAAVNGSSNNSSLGADISSFMQSSAAEVGGAVETGMWTAAFNTTENRSQQVRLVERRTSQLRSRLAELRQRKQELIAEREAGNVTEVAYRAKVSNLIGRINALQSAINATTPRAKQVSADVDELTDLRTQAKNLSGPEISAVARNVTGVGVGNGGQGPPNDVDDGDRGPPDDVGNGQNANDASGGGNGVAGSNETTRGASNGTAPGASRGNGPANANRSASGPPNDAAQSAAAANGSTNVKTPSGIGNASANVTTTPGVGPANNTTSPGESSASLSAASGAATEWVGLVSDALGASTDALARVFASA